MALTFENVLKQMKAEQAKLLEAKTMEWYLNQIKRVAEKLPPTIPSHQATERQRGIAKDEVKGKAQKVQNKISQDLAGKMILYGYNPKHKLTLPYYDVFPLVFPLEPVEGKSFLGLNMHYLPPHERAKFMTSLYTLINNSKGLNEKSKLRLKYDFLKGAGKFIAFKPCLKRYLTSHVASQIIVIKPEEWNYVLMMPLARFRKKSELSVWQESIKKIING